MLVAWDDTDGPDGGCTTSLVPEVLAALPEYVLLDYPRLVRLCPDVPWKTRGNGAVCLRLGLPAGDGEAVQVGEWDGHKVWAYPGGVDAPGDESVLARVWQVVAENAAGSAAPGVAVFNEAPHRRAYWSAVQRVLSPAALPKLALSHATGDRRALIGCLGAAAWHAPRATYEWIAYRQPGNVGSPRQVDTGALETVDDEIEGCFHTYDAESGVVCTIPNTPCPVLAGIRGRQAEPLLALRHRLHGETPRGWFIWRTNHASGDHVMDVDRLAEAPTGTTISVDLTVDALPINRVGGHVFVGCKHESGAPVTLAAFEPTKGFRDVVRALRPGDHVCAVGSLRRDPDATIHLERLEVLSLVQVSEKADNPVCPSCRGSMKSRGRGSGFRCPRCHERAPLEAATWITEERGIETGWYEVPVMARRHLHRPVVWDLAPSVLSI